MKVFRDSCRVFSLQWLCDVLIEVTFLEKKELFGYWGNPRANLRLIATFFVALKITFFLVVAPCLYLINKSPETFINSETDPLSLLLTGNLSFLALWFGLFWKEKLDIHSKWRYLADLYNDTLKTLPKNGDDEYDARKLLQIGLALDILKMDMWGHSSYSDYFKTIFEEAITYGSSPASRVHYRMYKIGRFGTTKSEATEILDEYHLSVRMNKVNKKQRDRDLIRLRNVIGERD